MTLLDAVGAGSYWPFTTAPGTEAARNARFVSPATLRPQARVRGWSGVPAGGAPGCAGRGRAESSSRAEGHSAYRSVPYVGLTRYTRRMLARSAAMPRNPSAKLACMYLKSPVERRVASLVDWVARSENMTILGVELVSLFF